MISRRGFGQTVLGGAVIAGTSSARAKDTEPYKDIILAPPERARDLVGRLTLEEQVAQLQCPPATRLIRDPVSFEERYPFFKHGIGAVFRASQKFGPAENARAVEELQAVVVSKSRFGIPAFIFEECLHGLVAQEATSFPQAIGMSCSWDTELVQEVYEAVAAEARARGANMCFSPTLDITQDPRWGRAEECWGEDPYLAAAFATSIVRGLQGSSSQYLSDGHIGAAAKHFAGYGQTLGGRNFSPTQMGRRELFNTSIIPFKAAIEEAGLVGVMASHGEVDGVPAHSNVWLLQDVLRDELGFSGFVVSDYDDIRRLHTLHRTAETPDRAAEVALKAGVDLELTGRGLYSNLGQLVRNGTVFEGFVRQAAERLLTIKFKVGLFDKPFSDEAAAVALTASTKHKALARRAAEKSVVLLKNDNSTLPFSAKNVKRLLVVGPNAASVHLGGYSPKPFKGVSLLEGLEGKGSQEGFSVTYAEGCGITEQPTSDGELEIDKTVNASLADPEANRRLIAEAVEKAQGVDAIVMALGGNEQTARESYFQGDSRGERDSLELLGEQNELAAALLTLGKPTAAVLIHGRPLSPRFLAEACPAILDAWYPGEEGGHALADILFGDVVPSGKLTVSIARNVGQLPVYYYQQPSGWFREYAFVENGPLFPFGYGLSYTTFEIGVPRLNKKQLGKGDKIRLSVPVTNVGQRAGDEVLQVYIRDEYSRAARPVKELRKFSRISLRPGQKKTVKFDLTVDDLGYYDDRLQYVTEPGRYKIMVGADCVRLQTVEIEVVES